MQLGEIGYLRHRWSSPACVRARGGGIWSRLVTEFSVRSEVREGRWFEASGGCRQPRRGVMLRRGLVFIRSWV